MSSGRNPLRIADCGLRIRTARSAQSAIPGFTLTELLLVASIIVLVGGMSGGLYVGTYQKLLVEKAARQFLLTARYARMAAVEQQRPYELQLGQDNQSFLLATTPTSAETGQVEKAPVKDIYCRPVAFEGDVKFESVQVAPRYGEQTSEADREQKITFLPNGSAQAAAVQIGDGKTHYTIAVVAPTGKATLYNGPANVVRTASIDLDMQQE